MQHDALLSAHIKHLEIGRFSIYFRTPRSKLPPNQKRRLQIVLESKALFFLPFLSTHLGEPSIFRTNFGLGWFLFCWPHSSGSQSALIFFYFLRWSLLRETLTLDCKSCVWYFRTDSPRFVTVGGGLGHWKRESQAFAKKNLVEMLSWALTMAEIKLY